MLFGDLHFLAANGSHVLCADVGSLLFAASLRWAIVVHVISIAAGVSKIQSVTVELTLAVGVQRHVFNVSQAWPESVSTEVNITGTFLSAGP